MSVLVIGAAGMLLQSGRVARHAAQMAQASVLASELAALLRQRVRMGSEAAWPVAMRQLDVELAQAAQAGGAPDCRLQACTAAELLDFELNNWAARAGAVLPGARLVLCRDRNPWNAMAGRFDWACSKEDAAPLTIKLGWRPAAQGAPAGLAPLLVMAIE
jgi:type IV pilus assembly protein PilV